MMGYFGYRTHKTLAYPHPPYVLRHSCCCLCVVYLCVCAHAGILLPQPHPLPPFSPLLPHQHFIPPSNMVPPGNFHRPRHPFGPAIMRGPAKPHDTLIVRKIPKEFNTITKLSSHFEKFGTIVNLTVRMSLSVCVCMYICLFIVAVFFVFPLLFYMIKTLIRVKIWSLMCYAHVQSMLCDCRIVNSSHLILTLTSLWSSYIIDVPIFL